VARTILMAALAVAAFCVAFAVTRENSRPDAVSTAADGASTLRSPGSNADPLAPRPRGEALGTGHALPILRIRDRTPTAFEALVLERPRDFHVMFRPLQQALQADTHLTRHCFATAELVGDTTVEFSWRIESTAQRATASGLRFVQVHDGVALPDAVVDCLERELGGTYEALPDQDPFPTFSGAIPIRLSWTDQQPARP
jgi:hypothetical protein